MAKHHDSLDDGRTIADMSGVEHSPLFLPRLHKKEKEKMIREPEEAAEDEEEKPWLAEQGKLNKRERRWFIGGALGATAAIAAVYILAAFIFIFFLTKILL